MACNFITIYCLTFWTLRYCWPIYSFLVSVQHTYIGHLPVLVLALLIGAVLAAIVFFTSSYTPPAYYPVSGYLYSVSCDKNCTVNTMSQAFQLPNINCWYTWNTYIDICDCMWLYIHKYIDTYIHPHIHTHFHTHTHTRTISLCFWNSTKYQLTNPFMSERMTLLQY